MPRPPRSPSYAHAKQYKRARRQGNSRRRTIGDIGRKIEGDETLPSAAVAGPADATKTRSPAQGYALHAPEVECIGKGKAHKPYEFGVKVRSHHGCKGGQFAIHAKSLPGRPYDDTLETVISRS